MEMAGVVTHTGANIIKVGCGTGVSCWVLSQWYGSVDFG